MLEELGARLRDERKRLKLDQTAFGAIGAVSKNTQAAYESGKTAPDVGYLLAIERRGADIGFIMKGAVGALAAGPAVGSIEHLVDGDALAAARGALHSPGVRYKAEPADQDIEELAEQLGLIKLAEVDLTLGMGHSYLDESAVTKTERWFPKEWVRQFTNAPAAMLSFVRPEGDSMYPTINDRDIVLLDHSVKHIDRQDAIWALSYGGLGTIRRVRQMPDGSYLMHADNPSVRPQPAHDDEMFVIARVAGVMRRT